MKRHLRSFANVQVDFAYLCRSILFLFGLVMISICIDESVGEKILGWVVGTTASVSVLFLLLRLLIKVTVGLKDKDEKKDAPQKSNPQNQSQL